jgi:uncharacterized membrane protein required for colicin V production
VAVKLGVIVGVIVGVLVFVTVGVAVAVGVGVAQKKVVTGELLFVVVASPSCP